MCTHMCVFVSFCFEFVCICIILFCICILEFLESYYLHFPDPPQPCSGSHWGSKSSSLDQVESSLVDTGDQTQNVFITVVIIIMMSMTIFFVVENNDNLDDENVEHNLALVHTGDQVESLSVIKFSDID